MKQYRFFVYIQKCSDNSYYTGVTNNIEKRLSEHSFESKQFAYVFNRRPFKLVLLEEFNDIRHAISREKQIKGWSRKKKEALMMGDWDKISELAVCRNESRNSGVSFDYLLKADIAISTSMTQ